MSKKHKKVYRVLNYIEHSLVAICTIFGCISIFAFASLDGIPLEIASSAIELKICVITTAIKKYKSINHKNKKKHDNIISLAKSELNNIEALISKALLDSNFSHYKFVLINNVPEVFYDVKEEVKKSSNK